MDDGRASRNRPIRKLNSRRNQHRRRAHASRGLQIAFGIADHKCFREIEAMFALRALQKARLWFPASAPIGRQMRAVIDTADVSPRLRNLAYELLRHSL